MAMCCPSRACYRLEVVANGRNAKDENSYQGCSMKFRSQAEFVRFLPKHHLSWRYRIGDSHGGVAQLNLDGISLVFIPMKDKVRAQWYRSAKELPASGTPARPLKAEIRA
jgi:hypothetical protein